MLVPALVYIAINWSDSLALRGWAIPAATDIAFALGVLALLGKQVPTTLKLFLLTLAIMDDLGAIIIIAIFYTEHIAWLFISLAGLAIITLIVMNLLGVVRKAAYILVGILLWFFVLESGVHATLAGVVLALTIPLRAQDGEGRSPLRTLENSLHPWVAYAILPLFAFANAGVPLQGIHWSVLLEPVTLGVALGLIIGKQIGVFSFSWLAIKLGIAALPQRVSWQQLYGVSVLCGIGFTMSLFIGGLAFSGTPVADNGLDRIGILLGSLISAVSGYGLLHLSLKKQEPRYSGQAIRPAGHRLDDSPELEKQQTTS
jgi:NhaA family Na+:H+ antiporter